MWLEEFIILCEERDSKSHGQNTIGGTLRMLEEHKEETQSLARRKEDLQRQRQQS